MPKNKRNNQNRKRKNKKNRKRNHANSPKQKSPKTTPKSSSSHSNDKPIDSPLKLHYYDADVSDHDNHSSSHDMTLSPLHHPVASSHHQYNNNQNKKYGQNPKKEIQILRSAKISHRPIQKPQFISPGFDSNYHSIAEISQHALSPMPSLHRVSSEPLSSSFSLTPPRSILRSPSYPSPYKSASVSSDLCSSHDHHIKFGAVEVHEFKLCAGSESDGVPDEAGLALYLGKEEVNASTLDLDEYEQQRYERWKQRAKDLNWSKKKLENLNNLFTAGRCDQFFSHLSLKEREQRLNIDNGWKRRHSKEIDAEQDELDKLRKSRRRSENIFCNCKPLGAMSTEELKLIAKKHGIEFNERRKVKKGFLINKLKSKVLNYRDVCCWDSSLCSCVAAGIECHSGTQERSFQCGCIKYAKKCDNKNGRYIYKPPRYAKGTISEWKEYYDDVEVEKEEEEGRSVGFKL